MRGFYLVGQFIPYYGLMLVLGVGAATLLGVRLVKHFSLSTDDFTILGAYAIGGGILGAKILSLIQEWKYIDWSQIPRGDYLLMVLKNGYVFYGGLLGGIAAVFLAGKIHKIKALTYLEATIPCIPLAHAIGRIGCHLASCCYGIPYNGIGHIIYHSPAFAPTEIPLFPVQLLEAFFNFLLAVILTVYVWKRPLSARNIFAYINVYAVIRFLLEFLRYDTARGFWGILSTSQWISLILLLTSVSLQLIWYYKSKTAQETDPNVE